MYTQCPNCDTVFNIGVAQLKVAHGRVRCGHCDTIFDALHNLTEQLPKTLPVLQETESGDPVRPPARTAPDSPDTAPAIIATTHDETPRVELVAPEIPLVKLNEERAQPQPVLAPPHETSPTLLTHLSDFQPLRVAVPDDMAEQHAPLQPDQTEEIDFQWNNAHDARLEEDEPSDARPRRSGFSTLFWGLGVLALLGLLAAQYAFFMRMELARHDALRPVLEQLCALAATECNLPLRRNLGLLEIKNSGLRPHPTLQNALIVTATLVNKAAFPQPYPVLQLTLADHNGVLTVTRDFVPAEYLKPGADFKSGITSAATVLIEMEIATPRFNPATLDIALY